MTDKIVALLVINEIIKKSEKLKDRKRRKWMKWLIDKKKNSNENLLKLISHTEPADYKNYMRMSEKIFYSLLDKVKPHIQKQDTFMRDAIPAETRLSITLRFLATGNSFEDLKFCAAVSPQSISNIVIETCEAITSVLKLYIKIPETGEEWKIVAENFYQKSGFPHCIGAIDGKHVNIKKPHKSGSMYFNYKKTFSIVLMALVNADSEFLMVDVGTNGRISDGGVFAKTKFFEKLDAKRLNVPELTPMVSGRDSLPFVLVGDDAFPLRENLMKPYAHDKLTKDEELFNKKLSSARVKVENAFGILSSRFRVLHTTINLSPEKVTTIVLAICYLHNFLKKNEKNFCNHNIIEVPTACSQSQNFFGLGQSTSPNSSSQAKKQEMLFVLF